MTQPLSPAAQAVLDATRVRFYEERPSSAQLAAWILRALADHEQAPIGDGPIDHWNPDERTRQELHNIAAELQGGTRDPLEPNDLSHLSEEEFQPLAPQGYHGV